MAINSQLLELIENEIQLNNHEIYQKTIPIDQYNFETKRTLDLLIEKYSGLVKRFDDKVTLFISTNKPKLEKTIEKQPEVKTQTFDELNSVIDRLAKIEIKLNDLMETQNMTVDTNKKYASYMKYFKQSEEGKTLRTLVEEILNHR